jgi:uridine phosphorylase
MSVNKKALTLHRVQYHLRVRPGDVGKYVLLPGDPWRVPLMAEYLDGAKEVAHNREYLTYTGFHRGIKISITSTGIGGPSTAIAIEELANVGAEVFIRVGSTGALQEHIEIGDLVIATGAVRNESTSRWYVPEVFPAVPNFEVTRALIEAATELKTKLQFKFHIGIISTDDAFYAETPEFIEDHKKLGVLSLDMESSVIFLISHLRKLRSGSILAVSGNLATGNVIYEEENPKLKEGWKKETQVALLAIEKLEKEISVKNTNYHV